MNNSDLATYYLNNSFEFYNEHGHEKLLVGIKKFISNTEDDKVKTIGIDVGCCIGNYIEHLNDICSEKNKKILCFEPNPVNILELEKKIKEDDKLKLFKYCVSNENTTSSLYNWKDMTTNEKGNQIAGLRCGG